MGHKFAYVASVVDRIVYNNGDLATAGILKTRYDTPDKAYDEACKFLKSDVYENLGKFLVPSVDLKENTIFGTLKNLWITCLSIGLLAFSLICLFLLLHFGRKQNEGASNSTFAWIKAGDVEFQVMMVFGCLVAGTLGFFDTRTSDGACSYIPFGSHIAFCIVLGAFAGRTYKLYEVLTIFRDGSLTEKTFGRAYVYAFAPLVAVVLYLVVVVLIVLPFESGYRYNDFKFYRECIFEDPGANEGHLWETVVSIPFIFEVALISVLLKFLWALDCLQDQYKESTQILSLLFICLELCA